MTEPENEYERITHGRPAHMTEDRREGGSPDDV